MDAVDTLSVFSIRNHFISDLVLDSLEFKKHLERTLKKDLNNFKQVLP